nr:hypothetical protein [Tanacetum cinerariifolium]
MFLTHSNDALEIEKFKRSRKNKIKFAYVYGNLNASYVNEKINFEDDYFQDIINPDFEKIDSPFQQTSSHKPYVLNVVLEKIIIDLEDEVVSLLKKEKENLETIKSLKSKGFESSENVSSKSENQIENDCLVVEKEYKKEENPKVIAPGMFKLNVSQCVSPISMSKSSCESNNVEIKLKRKRCLPKMKFEKDHLCFACEQGKIHRKHHKFKTDFASNKPLYLLHMDLCGPMRVQSINGKRYVLVVVNDYSRVFELIMVRSLKTKLLLSSLMRLVLLNMFLLQEHHNKMMSWKEESNLSQSCKNYAYIRKPTIVSLAEAIATACFTHNRSIIHKRFDKTPYELMNKRKPNIKFFRMFGCRCYLLNDYEDVGKLKAKGDIGVFVRYSKESDALRIYNKQTRKIHESVNVNFDEISEMASKQFSFEPDLSNLNETGKSSNLSISQVDEASKKDLEDLFQDFYDEYFDYSKIMKSSTTNVETSINEEVFHEVSELFQGESSSSSLNDDVQQRPEDNEYYKKKQEVLMLGDSLTSGPKGNEYYKKKQEVLMLADSLTPRPED